MRKKTLSTTRANGASSGESHHGSPEGTTIVSPPSHYIIASYLTDSAAQSASPAFSTSSPTLDQPMHHRDAQSHSQSAANYTLDTDNHNHNHNHNGYSLDTSTSTGTSTNTSTSLDLLTGTPTSSEAHGPLALALALTDLPAAADNLGISSATFMSMLHDGSLDMGALFHSDTSVFSGVGGGGGGGGQRGGSSNVFESTFAPGSAMTGLVSSP